MLGTLKNEVEMIGVRNAIKEAVVLAEYIPSVEIEQLSKQLAIVSAKVERGSALASNLFGIEERSKQRIESDLAISKHEQSQLQERITLGTHYHLLSMEPLTWRDKNGWPRLVVFSLNSPDFEITVTREWSYFHERGTEIEKKISPTLPKAIFSCYVDVFKALRQRMGEKNESISLKLSCRFEGLIPDDVKQKIAEAHELRLFKGIFLIAEPNGFEINRVVEPKRDPLVIGFDGSQLWLIADFKTTPVEEAMIFSLPDAKGFAEVVPKEGRKNHVQKM